MRRRPFLPPLQAAAAAFCFLVVAGCSSATSAPMAPASPGSANAAAPATDRSVPAVIDLSGNAVAPSPMPRRAATPASGSTSVASPAIDRPRVISPGIPSKAPPHPVAASSPAAAAHDAARARLDTLIGEPACQSDAQCRTVAVGARACGGPVAYRAWSTAVTDGAALQEAGQRERDLALQVEREAGRMSICLFIADPGAQCVRGRCETKSTPAPQPAVR
jgi:hypothetical protein